MLHQAEGMTVLGLETKTRDKARYPLVTHLNTNAKVTPLSTTDVQAR